MALAALVARVVRRAGGGNPWMGFPAPAQRRYSATSVVLSGCDGTADTEALCESAQTFEYAPTRTPYCACRGAPREATLPRPTRLTWRTKATINFEIGSGVVYVNVDWRAKCAGPDVDLLGHG